MSAWSRGGVIVTGGSRGIGAAIVRRLAQRGVPVLLAPDNVQGTTVEVAGGAQMGPHANDQ